MHPACEVCRVQGWGRPELPLLWSWRLNACPQTLYLWCTGMVGVVVESKGVQKDGMNGSTGW